MEIPFGLGKCHKWRHENYSDIWAQQACWQWCSFHSGSKQQVFIPYFVHLIILYFSIISLMFLEMSVMQKGHCALLHLCTLPLQIQFRVKLKWKIFLMIQWKRQWLMKSWRLRIWTVLIMMLVKMMRLTWEYLNKVTDILKKTDSALNLLNQHVLSLSPVFTKLFFSPCVKCLVLALCGTFTVNEGSKSIGSVTNNESRVQRKYGANLRWNK